jgi:hypothetical protein
MATEFARMARGTAMSLFTFCFMGGGGIGTAIGGKIISQEDYLFYYALYGLLLVVLLIASRFGVKHALSRGIGHSRSMEAPTSK